MAVLGDQLLPDRTNLRSRFSANLCAGQVSDTTCAQTTGSNVQYNSTPLSFHDRSPTDLQDLRGSMSHIKAVIFDIGGVVMRSPFIAIAAYEKKLGIPENYLNCSIVERGPNGAWQKFERGELPLFPFYEAFSRDLSDTTSGNVWYAAYCKRKGVECPELPQKLNVDGREVTAGKHKIIALTNNYARTSTENPIPASELAFLGWDREGATPSTLRGLFDDFCDSSELGSRKPERRFYQMALDRNGLRAEEVVFLDDIGINLKAAKELGMETIHVPIGGTLTATKKLEAKLGIDLTSQPTEEEVMAKL
ncbi:Epoxide hydrolase [Mycena venus]|uniref:Epoxide hydrolase n=1 Tax=Mycena venus TaxID=2733690 RepID=A0A8H7CZY5_9AGAR|nr:Epoxide hydrolase [Mycena venus]